MQYKRTVKRFKLAKHSSKDKRIAKASCTLMEKAR